MDQETNMTLNQNVDMLFTNLESFTQKEGVIGKPVVHENKTFLPVVSVTLGYGGGNSANKTQPENNNSNQTLGGMAAKMAGGALGFGAKLFTEAVIVIDKDKDTVSMMSLTSAASNLTEKIPQMIMNMGQNKQSGQQGGGTQGQGGTGGQSGGMGTSGGGYGNQ